MLTTRVASICTRSLGRRSIGSTSRVLPSAAYTHPTGTEGATTASTPNDITSEQRGQLDAALRVDHAGEIAANWIYRGQYDVLGQDKAIGPLIQVSIQTYLSMQSKDIR
jgi:3-demethoxyubiquinol 3-hydroxylase